MLHDASADDLTLDPWMGRVLAQRYRVVARIGAGGMGVVYRAWDEAIGSYVVIKTPKRELIGDPRFLQRFAQEMSALRALSHRTVVPISDVGHEEGMPFAVMPYLAGGSLKQRRPMFQDGRVAPDEPAALWRWLPTIAQALDFVHASSYVHRDVKPDNILFDGPGTPYLSDFGVAKLVFQEEDAAATRGLTGTGFALGTPEYMAPELISGTKANPRVDQYALAIVTYELLAARKPFDGPTPAAVMIAHATGTAPPLASLRPEIPSFVSEAVARGMAKSPADRFDSCTAFARAVLAQTPHPAAVEKLQLMCPRCGRLLNVKPDWAGKQGNCPRCKTALTIGGDLRSLWIPSDKTASPTPSDRIQVGQLGSTPSQPIPVRRATPPPTPSRVAPPATPETAIEAIKAQFAKSVVLQGLAALLLAVGLVAVLVSFSRKDRNEGGPQPAEMARADHRLSAAASPRVVRADPAPALEATRAEPEPAIPTPSSAPSSVTEEAEVTEAPSDNPPAFSDAPPAPAEAAAVEAASSRSDQADGIPETEPSPPEEHERLPVPAANDVEEAIALAQRAFEEDYSRAQKRGALGGLIDTLVDTANSTKDATRRYALLVEAERLAVEGLDLTRVMTLISDRAKDFDIDAAAEQKTAIGRLTLAKNRAVPELFRAAIQLARESLENDTLPVADAAAGLASSVAKAIDREQKAAATKAMRDAKKKGARAAAPPPSAADTGDLLDEAAAIQKAVRARQELFDTYRQALATLDSAPNDAAAHTTVARYLCFTKQDWSAGLTHLAQGDLDVLSPIAVRHLAAKNNGGATAQDFLRLAGDWWQAGEDEGSSLAETERAAVLDFAASLYDPLLNVLSDPIDVALAQKRAKRNAGKRKAQQGPATLADLLVVDRPQEESGAAASPKRKGRPLNEFSGRTDSEIRRQFLEQYGGTQASETAIDNGLNWLVAHQLPDGGWHFDMNACPNCEGKCSNSGRGSSAEDRCGATSLALLAFYGRGHTHKDGPYKQSLLKGIGYLAALSQLGGGKCHDKSYDHYSQAAAGIALSECLALTKEARLKVPAQAALNYIMATQDPKGGGWGHYARSSGDTPTSGWQLLALRSGNMAGLTVMPETLKGLDAFLNSVQEHGGATYGYSTRGEGSDTSAIGLLCRSYLGWANDQDAMKQGIARLVDNSSARDLHTTFFLAQLLRRVGGADWHKWHALVQQKLLAAQVRQGHAAGSWYEEVNSGSGVSEGGRLYCTAMAIMILESYYRYLSPADIAAMR